MKNQLILVVFGLFVIGCTSTQSDIQDQFEDDVSTKAPIRMSLAGSSEPDIVRFLKVQNAIDPSLSPDGKMVAFKTRLTGEYQIWVTSTNQPGFPKQITFGNSVIFHKWSPDNSGILYATDKEGDEKVGYYYISINGLHEKELLPSADAYRFFGDFNEEGTKFTYSTTERNGTDFDIHVYDLINHTDKAVYFGKIGYFPKSFSPDGKKIIISEPVGEDANNLFLLDISDSSLTQINQPGDFSYYRHINWKADGNSFYFLTNKNCEYTGIAHYTIEDQKLKYLVQKDYDIEQVLYDDNRNLLHWIANVDGYSEHHILDLEKNERIKAPDWPKGTITLRVSDNGHILVANVFNPQIPGDLWSSTIGANKIVRVTYSGNAGLDLSKISIPTAHSFLARDSIRIHGLLYSPEDLSLNTPLILKVHGGPTEQARPNYDGLTQFLVAKGFSVFDLNFRGSSGYGKTYIRANNHRKRENDLYDLEDAVNYLVNNQICNPDKIAVMGQSYGGYLTMAAMTRLPEVFSCGVALRGVSNWITALEDASPFLKASDRLEYGNINDSEDRAFFKMLSPIYYIDQVKSPMMVIHGANDTRVPVTESDRFVEGIRNNGGEVEYIRFSDEGHGILKMENRIIAFVRIAEFLESNLNNSP